MNFTSQEMRTLKSLVLADMKVIRDTKKTKEQLSMHPNYIALAMIEDSLSKYDALLEKLTEQMHEMIRDWYAEEGLEGGSLDEVIAEGNLTAVQRVEADSMLKFFEV